MKINYSLERINQRISKASKDPELVQNYSRKMTSDAEGLSQLAFVDKLRKKIVSRVITSASGPVSKVDLIKIGMSAATDASSTATFSSSLEQVFNQHGVRLRRDGPCFDDNADTFGVYESDGGLGSLGASPQPSPPALAPSSSPPPPIIKHSPSPLATVANQVKQGRGRPRKPEHLKIKRKRVRKTKNKTGFSECPTCKKMVNDVRRHSRSVHLNKRYKCTICNIKDFSNPGNLTKHKKICKGERELPTRPRALVNPGRRDQYVRNLVSKTYDCTICKQQFATSSNCVVHFRSAHLKKKWKCEICNIAEYSVPSSLIRHKETCLVTLPKRLEEAEKRNSDPRFNFKCTFCGKDFLSNTSLNLHKKFVHFNVRKHACDLCDKKFHTGSALEDHKDGVHFGNMYTCEYCKKKYRGKANFCVHRRKCCKKKVKPELAVDKCDNIDMEDKDDSFIAAVNNQNISQSQVKIEEINEKIKCEPQ